MRLRAVIIVCLAAAALLLGRDLLQTWQRERALEPTRQEHSTTLDLDRPFQRQAMVRWMTGTGRLFYAIIVAHDEFEPTVPTVSYRYAYSVDAGGTLSVDGRTIGAERSGRLLALDPFGTMRELVLDGYEMEIVRSGKAEDVWSQVALPRLWRFSGDIRDGRRSGHAIVSDTAGTKAAEGVYMGGRRQGTWRHFRPSGEIYAETAYAGGRRDGTWTLYDAAGEIIARTTWKDDAVVEGVARQQGLGYAELRTPHGSESRIGH